MHLCILLLWMMPLNLCALFGSKEHLLWSLCHQTAESAVGNGTQLGKTVLHPMLQSVLRVNRSAQRHSSWIAAMPAQLLCLQPTPTPELHRLTI